MKTNRKNIIRYIALLLFLAIGVTQSNAVFKERDFGKTIDVLCAELEQKYKELDETVGKLVSDITAADVAYMKAEDAGASQEELDRLKAERAQIANKRDAVWEERRVAEAELKDAKAPQSAQQNG